MKLRAHPRKPDDGVQDGQLLLVFLCLLRLVLYDLVFDLYFLHEWLVHFFEKLFQLALSLLQYSFVLGHLLTELILLAPEFQLHLLYCRF